MPPGAEGGHITPVSTSIITWPAPQVPLSSRGISSSYKDPSQWIRAHLDELI